MKVKFKNVAFAIATVALAGVIAHQAYAKQQEYGVSDLLLENVEALSDEEMPNVDDCVDSMDVSCIALHPTNPKLDKIRPDAEWP